MGLEIEGVPNIGEILRRKEALIEAWEAQDQALAEFDRLEREAEEISVAMPPNTGHGCTARDREPCRCSMESRVQSMDHRLWVFVIEKTQIVSLMTEAQKVELFARLEREKTPFNAEEIRGLVQNSKKMVEDIRLKTIREVYRSLIGIEYRSGDWRVNRKQDNLQKVEKVFRVGYSDIKVDSYGLEKRWESNVSFRFNELLRVCKILESGQDVSYADDFYSILKEHRDRAFRAKREREWTSDFFNLNTPYFNIQGYRNGNVKVRWHAEKLDILDRLNLIGSGRSSEISAGRRKRYKAEHFEEWSAPGLADLFPPLKGPAPSDDRDFNFYETKPRYAKILVGMLGLDKAPPNGRTSGYILDPSAGKGALISAIHPEQKGHRRITAVEFNHHRAQFLGKEFFGVNVVEADFLRWRPGNLFRYIIMNPPFNRGEEWFHVSKAWSALDYGGKMAFIVPSGWISSGQEKAKVVREFIAKHQIGEVDLPAGAFSGTSVQCKIVAIQKPELL